MEKLVRAISLAAYYGDADELSSLLTTKYGLRALHANDDYPLLYAARNGHASCVDAILKSGAVFKTHAIAMAIRWASAQGHADCIRLLLNHDGKVHADTIHMAMKDACVNRHVECMKLLQPLCPCPREMYERIAEV